MRRALILLTLAALPAAAAAQHPQPATPEPLPRQTGPVKLGMTQSAFAQLAHVIPECVPADQCGPHEARANAFIDTMPPDMGGLPGMQQFFARFIRDTLYAWTMRPPTPRLDALRAYYSGLYGPPQRADTTDSGVGLLIWASKTTMLIIDYARTSSSTGPRPGTVTGVEYIDVRLAKEAQTDQGLRPWP